MAGPPYAPRRDDLAGGGAQSSADLYASVPLNDGAYPPIRSITPQTPQVVQPHYAAAPLPASSSSLPRPPSYLAQHGRSDSTHSDYSARDPFRASVPSTRPGTSASYAVAGGMYDSPDPALHGQSGRYSPSEQGSQYGAGGGGAASSEWGSSANLNQIMYRNGPAGAQAGRSDSYLGKEAFDGGAAAAGGLGALGAARDGRSQLRKKGYDAADYDPLNSPRRGARGWWARKSTLAKWLIALAALLVLIAAIAIPVGVVTSRNNADSGKNKINSATSSNDGAPPGIPTEQTPPADWHNAAAGGNGSVVYLADGSNFTYINNFGAFRTWGSRASQSCAGVQVRVLKC